MTADVSTDVSPAGTSTAVRLAPVAGVGILAGFLAGLFGVGGGILIVPALVLVAHMDQRLAHGTSLAAVVPISLASALSYAVQGNVDWPVAAVLAVGAMAGAVVGTRLLDVLPHRTLALLFVGVLLASAIRLFVAADADGRSGLTVGMVVALLVVGLATGIVAGLLGVGGGVVLVPAMIVLFHIPPVVAKGTSAAVIVPAALMGTWRNRSRGNTHLTAALIIGVAGLVTATIGSTLAGRMSDTVSNTLFATLLMLVAARLLWQLNAERVRRR